MFFRIVGHISDVETIASGKGIREARRLRRAYGGRRWKKLKGTAVIELADGTMCHAEVHCTKPTASALGSSSSNAFWKLNTKKTETQFVVCVKNKGYSASLELRKLYQAISDERAAKLHQLRIVDESGEDYLYPEGYFVPVQLPQAVERAVRRTTSRG